VVNILLYLKYKICVGNDYINSERHIFVLILDLNLFIYIYFFLIFSGKIYQSLKGALNPNLLNLTINRENFLL